MQVVSASHGVRTVPQRQVQVEIASASTAAAPWLQLELQQLEVALTVEQTFPLASLIIRVITLTLPVAVH